MCYRFLALTEGFDVVCNLFVEQTAVGHYDYRVEEHLVQCSGAHGIHCRRTGLEQFVSQPGQRVRLARACRVLYQIGLSDAHAGHVLLQLCHHVQLVVAGKNQFLGILHHMCHLLLSLGLAVVKQHIVHDDVGHRVPLQNLFPHVGGLVASDLVHRVACSLSIG